jgi:hypothetical protein
MASFLPLCLFVTLLMRSIEDMRESDRKFKEVKKKYELFTNKNGPKIRGL